jgi:ATP sulfurylase
MAHEYIQLKALSNCEADGLFISPVTGLKKSGDFLTEIVLKSYQIMIDKKIYPDQSVMLGGFNTYSRYSGPREAVFTAICRKNFGCSHFIIGRDHTGTQDFYKEDENRKYFEELGDLGIDLIFFDNVGFDLSKKKFTSKLEQGVEEISGSEIRNAFINQKKLPNWYMREDIQQMIFSEIKKGKKIFY